MSSLLCSLPDEVLKLVMQHVPLADRMRSCCLVSRRLHAAATAATDAVRLYGLDNQSRGLQWLSHHGQHVTKLHLISYHLLMSRLAQPLRQLPCPNLLELRVHRGCVQLGPGDGYPGVVLGCSKLTLLELSCNILDAQASAPLPDCLSTLVHLQCLSVTPWKPSPDDSVHGLHAAVLPCLKHLTSLGVRSLSVENLLQVGALSGLETLTLWVQGLGAVGPASVPGLAFPASLTNLTVMSDVEAGILSLVPTGLQALSLEEGLVVGPAEGPDSLLSHLARLHCLTSLRVDIPAELPWPAPGPAYSALTASSSLVSFVLRDQMLPAAAWQHVFPASRQLPHLTLLDVGCECGDWDAPAPESAWGAADLCSLVSCCPNLRQVADSDEGNGGVFFQHGSHVSELRKLTALTNIDLQYAPASVANFEATLQGLAAVTQLKDVVISLANPLTVGALLPLTRLTALTTLRVSLYPGAAREDIPLTWQPQVSLLLCQRRHSTVRCLAVARAIVANPRALS